MYKYSLDAPHGHLGVGGAGQLGGVAVCDGALLAQHGRGWGGGGPHPAGGGHPRQHFRWRIEVIILKSTVL